jgi:hypothetical protein
MSNALRWMGVSYPDIQVMDNLKREYVAFLLPAQNVPIVLNKF